MNRLRGMNKFLLKMFYKMMSDKAKDGDAEALEIVDAYRNNKDFVSLENLKEMLDWYRSAL